MAWPWQPRTAQSGDAAGEMEGFSKQVGHSLHEAEQMC